MTRDEELRIALPYVQEAVNQMYRHMAARDQQVADATYNATIAHLSERGLLLTPGKPVQVKTVLRDGAGRITSIVDETVEVHETRTTDTAKLPPAFWNQ